MKNNKLVPYRETAIITLGEAIVSAVVIAVFLAIGKYDYTVALGALLGSAVIILNFFFLSLSTNRAIDKIMALRPDGDMDEEQIAAFTKENTVKIQNTAKISYIIRTFSMLAAFIVALISGVFNVISTVIPLLMLRPIIYVTELIRKKERINPTPVTNSEDVSDVDVAESTDGEKNETPKCADGDGHLEKSEL